LTRPELAVLLAYAKMSLDQDLLASDLPGQPELADDLLGYFPAVLRQRFAAHIAAHPLRREITATVVANDLVNRAGPTFVHDMRARTGRTSPEIACSYRIVRDVFALPALWSGIEELDNRVPAAVQTEMLLDIVGVIEHGAAWLLRGNRLDIGRETARFASAVRHLAEVVAGLLPPGERMVLDRREARLVAAGVPQDLAARVAGLIFLTTAFEVGDLSERSGQPVDRAAQTFYGVGSHFALDEMRDAARRLPAETAYQKAAAETLVDDFYSVQAELATRVLASADGVADPLATWIGDNAGLVGPAEAVAAEMRTVAAPDLAMLVVASRQLRQVLA
jgi:glutamate dehydrogenase